MGRHDGRTRGRERIPPGLKRLAALVEAVASPDAAKLVAGLANRDAADLERLDVDRIAELSGFERTGASARIEAACRAFREAFSFGILRIDLAEHRGPWSSGDGETDRSRVVPISQTMRRILHPDAAVGCDREAPQVDGETAKWVAALARGPGDHGAVHVALRCRRDDDREAQDFAAFLRAAGTPTWIVDADADLIGGEMLAAELHRPEGSIVVVATRCLLTRPDTLGDSWDEPARVETGLAPSSFMVANEPWLRLLSHDHVWCIDADAAPIPAIAGLVGGCIAPMRYDISWLAAVAEHHAGVDAEAAAVLVGLDDDPHVVGATARVARRLSASEGIGLVEACEHVVRSFRSMDREAPAPEMPKPFDPRLLVCEADAIALLERGGAAAEHGARILAWGPPGGGKSTWARALSTKMATAAGRPRMDVTVVTPARILAKPLGASERILEAAFAKAARRPGAVLLVDEIDALTGVRATESSSGNDYLVRTLTDLWLRCLDLHPGVPVVATCNSLSAVDPAVRRRFLAFEFGDELSPTQERLAWDVILGMGPPTGWRPCGASVADIDAAAKRARLTMNNDPLSIAANVRSACRARRGLIVIKRTGETRSLQ